MLLAGGNAQRGVASPASDRLTKNPPTHSLTVILLGEVRRRLEDLRDEGGVDLPHGQVLDAVRVPVHVVTDALKIDRNDINYQWQLPVLEPLILLYHHTSISWDAVSRINYSYSKYNPPLALSAPLRESYDALQ